MVAPRRFGASMKRLGFLTLLLLFPLDSPGFGDEPKSLADRLVPLAKAHKGKVAIAVKHLDNGVSFCFNEDEAMPTASLIKFPVMIEVYMQVLEGKVKLSDMVTLRKEDMVGGAG